MSWRQHRPKMAVATVLMLGNAVAFPLAAQALRRLTDHAVAGRPAAAAADGAVVALLAVAALTCAHFAHIAYFEIGETDVLELDERLIALSNGSLSIDHHERPDHADRMTVVLEEVQRVRDGLHAVLAAGSLAVGMVVTAVLLASLQPVLLALPLLALPSLVAGRQGQRAIERARDRAAADVRVAKHLFRLATTAASAREVRTLRLGDEVRRRHAQRWQAASRQLLRGETTAAAWRAAGQLVFVAGYIGAVLLVLRDAVDGRRSIGDVVLAVVLAAQVNQQVAAAMTLLQEVQRAGRTFARLADLDESIRSREPANPGRLPVPPALAEGIRLDDVGFTYPGTDRPVLEHVDLLLPAGSVVAIVGENGAGKSTLVKLLCRFHEVDAGRVTVDGVDLRTIDAEAWRARIAAGFQDFMRFELTARETVGVGDLPRSTSDVAVSEALGRARSDVVRDLPDGLDTLLGTSWADGVDLSGGQWQQLALGRAMMRDRPLLLVLDEPTSAMDAEAEHRLFANYAESAARVGRLSGAVTVFVSHRFSTVRMADLIVVVAGGTVADAGSHEELMARGGLYAELYEVQATAYR